METDLNQIEDHHSYPSASKYQASYAEFVGPHNFEVAKEFVELFMTNKKYYHVISKAVKVLKTRTIRFFLKFFCFFFA